MGTPPRGQPQGPRRRVSRAGARGQTPLGRGAGDSAGAPLQPQGNKQGCTRAGGVGGYRGSPGCGARPPRSRDSAGVGGDADRWQGTAAGSGSAHHRGIEAQSGCGVHPAWEAGSGVWGGGPGWLRGQGSPTGAHQDCAGSGPPSDPMLCAWAGGSGLRHREGAGGSGLRGQEGPRCRDGAGGSEGQRAPCGGRSRPRSLPAGAERYGVGTGARGGLGTRVTVPRGDADTPTSRRPSHPRGPTWVPPPGRGRGRGPAGATGCAAECAWGGVLPGGARPRVPGPVEPGAGRLNIPQLDGTPRLRPQSWGERSPRRRSAAASPHSHSDGTEDEETVPLRCHVQPWGRRGGGPEGGCGPVRGST